MPSGLLNEVEIRLASVERAKEDNRIAIGLFAYQIVWAAIYFIAFLRLGTWVRDFTLVSMGPDALNVLPTIASDMIFLTNSAIVGGFGGIVAALRAIWRHASQKLDFSRQYTFWYIASPLMGLFMGALVFLAVRVLIFSLFIGAGPQEITSVWVLYILAGAAGFFQDTILSITRLIGKITSPTEN